MKIYILINNDSIKGFKNCWGLSILLEYNGYRLLFDTGCSGEDLLYNMNKFGIDIKSFKDIIISHDHWDHTGGIFSILNKHNKKVLHVGESFSKKFAYEIERRGALIKRDSLCRQIHENIFISNELPGLKNEQVLIINHKNNSIILAGCSHPKIEEFSKNVYLKFKKDIILIGGFHMFSLSKQEINERINQLKEIKIKRVYPLHCTGELAAKLFLQNFDTELKKAGEVIEL